MRHRVTGQRYFDYALADQRLRAGLVGHWIGDGSGLTLRDRSGYGNHGTLVNGPTWTLGVDGTRHCLSFDGVDDYVQANSVTTGDIFGNAHTISGWAKLSAWANNRTMFGAGLTSSIRYSEIDFISADKKIYARTYRGSSQNNIVSLVSYNNDSNWHHFASVVNDAGNIVGFYIDGVLQGSGSNNVDLSILDKFYIGQLPYTSANVNPWRGWVDDVRIYNRALSDAEIWLLYTTTNQYILPTRLVELRGVIGAENAMLFATDF